MKKNKLTQQEIEEYYLWKRSQDHKDNPSIILGCVVFVFCCLVCGWIGVPFAIGGVLYCIYKIGANDLELKNDPYCQGTIMMIEDVWRERAKGHEMGGIVMSGKSFTPEQWAEYKRKEKENHEFCEEQRRLNEKIRREKKRKDEELKRQYPECFK